MASLDLSIPGPTVLTYLLLALDVVGWEGLCCVVSLWRQSKGEAESGPCFPPYNTPFPWIPLHYLSSPAGHSPGHTGQHWSSACTGWGQLGGGQTTGSQITVRLCGEGPRL